MAKKTVIVSLGGSFLFSHPNALLLMKQTMMDMHDFNFGIIVGGGRLARNYIDFARRLGLTENIFHKLFDCQVVMRVYIWG